MKNTESQQAHRKDEHLSLGVKLWRDNDRVQVGSPFDAVRWLPNALPEIALDEVDVSTTLFNHQFEWPFYIEAMTGGSQRTHVINQQLAEIAAQTNLAMAVGSQSIALKEPEAIASFRQVRQHHPNGFLLANLGADHTIENVQRAIDMLEANAIELHINVGQELVMAEGDRHFYWLDNIANIAAKSPVPVIIKEVGFGMSQHTFQQLQLTGIAAINVGGANGTNFAMIERRRNRQQTSVNLDDFGLSTVESLLEAQFADNRLPLIATGGLQRAHDVVTSQMIGAQLTSSAGAFLHTLVISGQDALLQQIVQWQTDLPKLYALLGARSYEDLLQAPRVYSSELHNFIQQRQ
jgi:isopentenyl-diphosphate delta-isomerase